MHVSTDEVFGALELEDTSKFSERTPYDPRSPYAASKAGSDHLVRAYHETFGLPISITNCSNNFGPYMFPEKFIPLAITNVLEGKKIPVYGDGLYVRDWLYVDDHCRGIMQIIKNGKVGERYNLGGNNEWENIVLAKYICEVLDKTHPRESSYSSLIEFITDRPGHDFRYAIDITKINRELGWEPNETLESGIRKTIDFYWHKQG